MEPDALRDNSWLMFAFAHDLRAELRTVLTRIQMVQAGSAALLPEKDRAFLDEAVAAARDLNGLIDAMVSYTDAGAVAEKTTSLPLLLRGVLVEMKDALAKAGVSVSVTNESDATVPFALQAVIKELFANSCKFRRQDGKPEIRITTQIRDGSHLEISVVDNGLGVDPGLLDKLFIPFKRMHSRRDYPGFGLGLARCRRLVEACGGAISAAIPPGGGFAVTVTILVV